MRSPYVDHILHIDQFWAISIASGSVRLWDLSCVMRGCPRGLLQSSGGTVDRILLASGLLSICAMCPKGSGNMMRLLHWVWVVQYPLSKIELIGKEPGESWFQSSSQPYALVVASWMASSHNCSCVPKSHTTHDIWSRQSLLTMESTTLNGLSNWWLAS